MTKKDIERIERFMAWIHKKDRHTSLMVHSAPIGDMRATGEYRVEINQTADGRPFFTAKPKDERLYGLVYFD